jgi:hypothetical protein
LAILLHEKILRDMMGCLGKRAESGKSVAARGVLSSGFGQVARALKSRICQTADQGVERSKKMHDVGEL